MNNLNSLLLSYPDVAKEWHPTKNGELSVNDITAGSNKKVWWLGSCGHEWQATVTNRTNRKSGCPFCAGKKVIAGENDLATRFPQLSSEWDYEKNGTLTPQDVSPFSGKKVWWLCKNNHSWQAAISWRSSGNGCPYCAGKLPIIGETDLSSVKPELLSEWDYEKNKAEFGLTPESVTAHSNKKVWWKCSRGHEWLSTIDHRTNGHGCPTCSRHLQKSYPETAIFFFLSSIYPDAIQSYKSDFLGKLELDIYIPSVETAIEYDGSAYHNRKFSSTRENKKYLIASSHGIKLIRIRESGLPDCEADAQVLSHLDQYYLNSPSYNAELADIINQILSILGRTEIIDPVILEKNRTAIQSLLYSTAKESFSFPKELLDEWDYEKNGILRPNMFSRGSQQVVYWRCKEGHSWSASIKERVGSKNHKGTGCPYCSGNAVETGFNDFASKFPLLLLEWDYEKNSALLHCSPTDITSMSSKKVWWKCTEGHSWQAPVATRVSGRGCPICTNRVVLEGFNDLTTTNPDLVEQWDFSRNNAAGLFPNKVTRGSNKKAYWLCSLGHSWQAPIHYRAADNNGIKNGCPICANRIVLKGFNDFESQHPELLNSWDYEKNTGIAPSKVLAGSHKKVWWKCPYCNNRWQAEIVSRTSGSGCPKCSNVQKGQESRKANSDFVKELYGLNPDIIVLQPYLTSKAKITCRCKKCGNEWKATPNGLLHGYGCPKCGIKSRAEKSKKKVLCVEKNMVYDSLKDASAQSGNRVSSISNCCNGRVKTAGGYHWEFVSDD